MKGHGDRQVVQGKREEAQRSGLGKKVGEHRFGRRQKILGPILSGLSLGCLRASSGGVQLATDSR